MVSPSGIFHIMSRGINKMEIYRDSHDRLKYLDILHRVKKKFTYELFAFCLMTNHNHLLIKEGKTEISKVMASINIRYAMYFNKKYQRVGSLFQERYRSEPIRSEPQLLVCARYIHNNPVKAGIADSPGNYRWSSYHDYLDNHNSELLDCNQIMDMLGSDTVSARNQLMRFTKLDNDDSFLDYDSDTPEEDTRQVVEKLMKERFNLGLSEMNNLDHGRRCAIIAAIKTDLNLSYVKLGHIMGMSKDSIYRACKTAR